MADKTAIEWCDHTLSPWVGCTKVSDACDHCYAEAWAKRGGHPELWAGERRRTTASYWRRALKWDREAASTATRPRIFPSLCDPFDNQVPQQWSEDFWHCINQTPHLLWLLLTKRPQNIPKMLPDPRTGVKPWGSTGWQNVWLGTTAEHQEAWDRNVEALRKVAAPVLFVSVEPLLGPIGCGNAFDSAIGDASPYRPINWVIVGGESGPRARPMNLEWTRSIRDECVYWGVPCFIKQLGSRPELRDRKGGNPVEWPQDLRMREFPQGVFGDDRTRR